MPEVRRMVEALLITGDPTIKAYFVTFSRYNALANERLYDAAAALRTPISAGDRGGLL